MTRRFKRAQVGGQADRREMGGDPRRVVLVQQPEPCGERGGHAKADRDRFAVQDVAVAEFSLERVPERMAEIEQRAAVVRLLLALVVADDRRLEHAGLRDGVGLRLAITRAHVCAVRLAPGEECRIADQPGLGDFRIPCPQLTRGQRGQCFGVGEHHARLVEGAEKVLAVPRVNAGLAAHRAVDLGEQRRRHLDERQPPQSGRRRETGEIADHAAAERDHRGAALDTRVEQRVGDACIALQRLRAFAARHGDGPRLDPGLRQPRAAGPEDAAVPRSRRDTTTARFCGSTGASSAPARAQNAFADHDVVAARAKCHRHAARRLPCRERGRAPCSVVTSGLSSPQSTIRSASA